MLCGMGSTLIGQRFGRLQVITRAPDESRFNGAIAWICQCDCGTRTKGIVSGSLRNGDSQSCGCLRAEMRPFLHRTHGRSGTPEHGIWKNMLTRCYNSSNHNFKHYGARGITMCETWRDDFSAFFRDMGPRPTPKHTIDRIDNDGNYELSNCRWTTYAQQNRNYRRNIFLEFEGRRLTVTDWEIHYGFKPKTVLCRIKRGWSVERALTTPLR